MNSFELNKVLGAILATCLGLLALNIVSDAIFATEKPAKPGYLIAVKEAGPGKAAPAKKQESIEALLTHASAQKGESVSKQCHACHTLEKGGPNRVGPNLWNIVGSARGEGRGFNFSSAMKSKGGTWTYDELNKFLAGPQQYIPGTKMTFAGVKDDQKRAELIAYLRTLSDSPKPLPQAAQAQPKEGAGNKPAEAPKNGAKPEAKPGAQPAAKPEAKPGAQPEAKPEAKPPAGNPPAPAPK